MGAKQSKRSVDITNSPTKGEAEAIGEGEGRVVKIGDADIKSTTNGAVPHTDIEIGEKDETAKELTAEKEDAEKEVAEVKENGVSESEDAKTPDSESVGDNLNETEKSPESTENKVEETAEAKKQKEKKKKKWSFRSISFSKKDKSKPAKDSEKNGDVKEVAEENVDETATSPSTETPKTEKVESPEETPVLNGEASKEELANDEPKSDAAAAATEERKKEEPSVTEPVKDKPETEPVSEPKVEEHKPEEPKPVDAEPPKVPEPVVESDPSPKEQEEPAPTNPLVEEIKEVRNEELPPPLPSSNPPSSVTVFAESTKADILTTAHIDLLETASAEVIKSEVEPVPVSDVDLKHPDQENVTDIAVPKESEPKLEISPEIISENEVAKESESKPDIIPETNVVDSPVAAADIEKPIANSEAEVAELSSVVSDSSVSEIKVASESLASIPDPELCESEAAKHSEIEVVSEPVFCETKVASVESITSLEPQPAETNLLKNISEKSLLTETCLSPEKLLENPSEQETSEPLNSLNAALGPQITETLKTTSEASLREESQQKSETESKSELLTMSSEISEISLTQSNKTDPAESLSSLPPQSIDLPPPPNVIENSKILVPEINEKPSEKPTPIKLSASELYKDSSQATEESIPPTEESVQPTKSENNAEDSLQDKAEKHSSEMEVISDDSSQLVKPEEEFENSNTELPSTVTSEANSEDKFEKSANELPAASTEVIPSELSLVYSEESSETLLASECVPSEELKPCGKVDDSEEKSASEDFPIDLPSPTDLPPPSSVILDRVVDPADSLPDISTESLPSLPEPVSDNLAEPMSLPPVDSVPEPIATDCLTPSESIPHSHPVLTNGNTNGLPSPSDDDVQMLKEGQLKQVPPAETPSEVVKNDTENVTASEVASVEE
ncbi:cell surface glycoprotein 1-like isoform X1 [Diorhabda carinulata]|uniref:cell surface glycoprotein 1-like isoform X1 n=1 Tax=Diorhabda carinulata TaxID=1163345 RepID=UPI0025A22D13|nr:cell surface glycoprotein 1-like isoform X1 [Diorhabda carinulata]XP_057671015.1 cell surface glycoprotein 1-like isoform X1 [Diorhabda carinulata]XP_057671016.1 cell surface glycoprotein 1-like isoform X1 [Diorhabda carinulata]XP_057671017.1 cell surface glycoprotein 1-like isoform X1 [Diorhabda carinulata]